MKLRKEWTAASVVALGGVALAWWASPSDADGLPSSPTMYYSGVLEEDGVPVDGSRSFTVSFWPDRSSGTALCEVTEADLRVDGGSFRVPIRGRECVDAIHAHPEVFVQLQVGTEDPLPRVRLGAVPYAVEAETAQTARRAEAALPGGGLDTRVAAAEARIARAPVSSGSVTVGVGVAALEVVPGLSVEVTTHGGPVSLELANGDPTIAAWIRCGGVSSAGTRQGRIVVERDSGSGFEPVGTHDFGTAIGGGGEFYMKLPPSSVRVLDEAPPAGTHVYRVLAWGTPGTFDHVLFQNVRLIAWEDR